MLKYYNSMVVFSEIPDEITLAVNISNCPCRCDGCHSKYLWGDVGIELTEDEMDELISLNSGITCVCLMGHGGIDGINEAAQLALHIKAVHGLKTGLYSGFEGIVEKDVSLAFDFVKEGRYIEELGGLTSSATNQRFYVRDGDKFTDRTCLFWGNKKAL